MIPTLIIVISLLAAMQFFLSVCRSTVVAAARVKLSEAAREAIGIREEFVPDDDFRRLLLLLQLCPDVENGHADLRKVRVYYGLLVVLQGVSRVLFPTLASWAAHERVQCSHYIAVILDERIAYQRRWIVQQDMNP